MTGKHRDQLCDIVITLLDHLRAGASVEASYGLRNPETGEITLFLRVRDDEGKLAESGICGLVDLGSDAEPRFNHDRGQAAEFIANLLMNDAKAHGVK